MEGRRFDAGKVAPVKVGAELDVKIEGVGEKGDGIAKVQGFVLFVPGVRTGDEVRIKVTRVLSKVGFAEVLSRSEGTEESGEEESGSEKKTSGEEGYGDSPEDSDESTDESSDDYQDSEDF
jgi:predicted RNA-binding protein with TRAM domain